MKRFLMAASCVILACCNAQQPTKTKMQDDVNGMDLILEHRAGPALSQPEDKLYIVSNDGKKLVFEGYGGSPLSILPLREGVLVVAYCGGSIRNTESFLAKDNLAGKVTAVKIQPIITSGIQINGRAVCEG